MDRVAKLIGEFYVLTPSPHGPRWDGSLAALGIRFLNGRSTVEVVAVANVEYETEMVTRRGGGSPEYFRRLRLRFRQIPLVSLS